MTRSRSRSPHIRGRAPETELERSHVDGGGDLGDRVVDLQKRVIREDVLAILEHMECQANSIVSETLSNAHAHRDITPQGQRALALMLTTAADWTTTSVCFVMYILDFECSRL